MSKRWLVDAMNVIGSRPDRWWNDPDRAMLEFATSLDDYVTQTGESVTIVFDRKPAGFREAAAADVVFASRRGRNAADYEIELIVTRERDPGGLNVVTSDKKLAEKARSLGAHVVPSGAFRTRLDRIVGKS